MKHVSFMIGMRITMLISVQRHSMRMNWNGSYEEMPTDVRIIVFMMNIKVFKNKTNNRAPVTNDIFYPAAGGFFD